MSDVNQEIRALELMKNFLTMIAKTIEGGPENLCFLALLEEKLGVSEYEISCKGMKCDDCPFSANSSYEFKGLENLLKVKELIDG